MVLSNVIQRPRPYHVGNTGSRPITEVKQRWARLVLAWVTGWEYRVLRRHFAPSSVNPTHSHINRTLSFKHKSNTAQYFSQTYQHFCQLTTLLCSSSSSAIICIQKKINRPFQASHSLHHSQKQYMHTTLVLHTHTPLPTEACISICIQTY